VRGLHRYHRSRSVVARDHKDVRRAGTHGPPTSFSLHPWLWRGRPCPLAAPAQLGLNLRLVV
jgi:hypothetical protein